MEGDTHDDLDPLCQEIDFVFPVEESFSDSNFDKQDMIEKQQMQENQEFIKETHAIQDESHVEPCNLESKPKQLFSLLYT